MATTLIQGVDRLAIDAGILGNKDFPKSLLTYYLNMAQKFVQKSLDGLGMKKWQISYDATANLAAAKYNGQSVKTVTMAQIATGAGHDVGIYPGSIRLIECGDAATLTGSTNFGVALEADEKSFHKLLGSGLLGPAITEPRFCWMDNQIVISPATVLSCMVHFYSVVKDLSADTDNFEVPDEFIEYVIKRAKIDVLDRQQKLNNKDEAIAQIDKEIKDQFATLSQTMNTQPQTPAPVSLS